MKQGVRQPSLTGSSGLGLQKPVVKYFTPKELNESKDFSASVVSESHFYMSLLWGSLPPNDIDQQSSEDSPSAMSNSPGRYLRGILPERNDMK